MTNETHSYVEENYTYYKAWKGDWQGCATAIVSIPSDGYVLGIEKRRENLEADNYDCRNPK